MVHAYCIQLFKSNFICRAFLCHVVSVLAPGEIGYIFDVSQLYGSVAWCRVLLCGVLWVCCGVLWCGCGVLCCGVVWCVWCAVVCCGSVAWCGVLCCAVMWCGVVWCEAAVFWHDQRAINDAN